MQSSLAENRQYPSIAFIGAGNMSRAIFIGMIDNGYPPEQIFATGREISKLADLAELGIKIGTDNTRAAAESSIVLLGVKPQLMQGVTAALKPVVQRHKPLIISVAAGVTTQSLNEWLGGNLAIVRCMPNTPALVQLGASALYANTQVSQAQKDLAQQVIANTGIALWVDTQAQLDIVTALSGSGPAYFFMLMESMIDAAVSQGLPVQIAEQLTLQTAAGAAAMAQQSKTAPAHLRKQVTSPKGTTEQAIVSFEKSGFAAIIKKGMQANIDRSKQLAIELA